MGSGAYVPIRREPPARAPVYPEETDRTFGPLKRTVFSMGFI